MLIRRLDSGLFVEISRAHASMRADGAGAELQLSLYLQCCLETGLG